jgi:16S rRNA (cytosine1402-N4)-methyltransferase
MTENTQHTPVLLEETVRLLNPQPGEVYFDGTAGYGGHAKAMSGKLGSTGRLILVDRDHAAVQHLQRQFGQQADILQLSYAEAVNELLQRGEQVDLVLLDLGVSSPQLDQAERGFSFRHDGPLDMRMDQTQELNAADVVNTVSESELADILYQYGEERRSRRIAKAIVANRPFMRTKPLADLIARTIGRSGDIHPATRSFQALRIYVNRELEQLETALPKLIELLKPGGRIAVISFHSLEDRIVKEFFNRESQDCICPPEQPVCTCNHIASLQKLTKRAISGSEDAFNPRARSAKLRAAVKINKN